MTFSKDAVATLYQNDPRYNEDGYTGMRLSANDAYMDIEKINLDEMFEEQEFHVRGIESEEDGSKTLPIQPDSDFKFLEAYGFLFEVIDVSKSENSDYYDIVAKFDPEQLLENLSPLTATHIGNRKFQLNRKYDHDMPKPAALRGQSKSRWGRVIILEKTEDDMILQAKPQGFESKKVDENELVKIMVNWDPSAISYGQT